MFFPYVLLGVGKVLCLLVDANEEATLSGDVVAPRQIRTQSEPRA
jgi:hypothetical protein